MVSFPWYVTFTCSLGFAALHVRLQHSRMLTRIASLPQVHQLRVVTKETLHLSTTGTPY